MKLINQSAEYLPQGSGIEGIYKQIELASRTSYLSWDKMTDDSAKKFVDMLIKSKHTSVLEHGTVYLHFFWPGAVCQVCNQTMPHKLLDKYCMNSYSKVNYHGNDVYVTTNMRVLQENNWLDDLKYLCEPTEFHEKRLSVKVITDIGVTREFNRHRTFSIVEQSTRYCNFSNDKFGNEITFVKPYWYEQFDKPLNESGYREDGTSDMFTSSDFEDFATVSQCNYMSALIAGMQPQQARELLPLCTKTEAFYTAFESDWRHFFDLRLRETTGAAHPQAKALAQLIYNEFEKYGLTGNMG